MGWMIQDGFDSIREMFHPRMYGVDGKKIKRKNKQTVSPTYVWGGCLGNYKGKDSTRFTHVCMGWMTISMTP